MEGIKELHKLAINAAQNNFFKFKRCAPVIFAHNEKGNLVIPLEFKDDIDKESALNAAKVAMLKNKVTCYSIINEAWMLKLDTKGDDLSYDYNKVRPSKHKDRVEVLIIVTTTKDKKIGTIFRIVRENDTISLQLEIESQEGMEGAFTELLDSMWE
jgi:hypothetical protein